MKILTPEVQNWIEGVWFPSIQESELKHFAFINGSVNFPKVSFINL